MDWEFNVGISDQIPIADMNQTQLDLFFDKFYESKAILDGTFGYGVFPNIQLR